jgi:hypothetical protein
VKETIEECTEYNPAENKWLFKKGELKNHKETLKEFHRRHAAIN